MSVLAVPWGRRARSPPAGSRAVDPVFGQDVEAAVVVRHGGFVDFLRCGPSGPATGDTPVRSGAALDPRFEGEQERRHATGGAVVEDEAVLQEGVLCNFRFFEDLSVIVPCCAQLSFLANKKK